MKLDFAIVLAYVITLWILHAIIIWKGISHLKKNYPEKLKEMTTKYENIPIINYRLRIYNGQYLALFTKKLALDNQMERYIILYKLILLIAFISAIGLIIIIGIL